MAHRAQINLFGAAPHNSQPNLSSYQQSFQQPSAHTASLQSAQLYEAHHHQKRADSEHHPGPQRAAGADQHQTITPVGNNAPSLPTGIIYESNSGRLYSSASVPTLSSRSCDLTETRGIASVSARGPLGTTLNKQNWDAIKQDEIRRDVEETRERLRMAALNKKVSALRPSSASVRGPAATAGPITLKQRAASHKKTKRTPQSATQRHEAQQARRENSYITQNEFESLTRPYESTAVRRAQSASSKRTGKAKPIPHTLRSTRSNVSVEVVDDEIYDPDRHGEVLYTASGQRVIASPHRLQQQQQLPFDSQHNQTQQLSIENYNQATGNPVTLSGSASVSSFPRSSGPVVASYRPSPQSAWGPVPKNSQPIQDMQPAGVKGKNDGNDMANLLAGGHEYVRFGRQNAPSAETRVSVGITGGSPSNSQDEKFKLYAPYATCDTTRTAPANIFNDESGAIMVVDPLVEERHHASASIGFGKRHVGYKNYVLQKCAENAAKLATTQQPKPLINPFVGNGNPLQWSTAVDSKDVSGSTSKSRWSRTNSDYGSAADLSQLSITGTAVAHNNNQNNNNNAFSSPVHVHTAACAHSAHCSAHAHSSTRSPTKFTRPAHVSSGNPLNPMSAEELQQLTETSRHPVASIGYGRKMK